MTNEQAARSLLAREILNKHCEYMDGLDRGQRFIGTDQALRAVIEAITAADQQAREQAAACVSEIDVLKAWFGDDRYAGDYEYLNAQFGNQAKRIARGIVAAIRKGDTK